MKAKQFFLCAAFAATALAVAFTACKDDPTEQDEAKISVTLSLAADTLTVGDTLRLTATVLPENTDSKTVVWRSSDTAVATVSKAGLVAALGVGAASIIATTADGGKADTCRLTVTYANMTLGGVTWAAANVDDFQTFAAKPDMYTKFYQWNRATALAATGNNVTGWDATLDTSSTWTVNPCPAGWRLPTMAEFTVLDSAGGRWAAANAKGNAVAGSFYGVSCATCSLPNNMAGCVFFPASGIRFSANELYSQGVAGFSWSGTSSSTDEAYHLFFRAVESNPAVSYYKSVGLPVRCVRDAR